MNKTYAAILFTIGCLSLLVMSGDITLFIFTTLLSLMLVFSKEDVTVK